jgi:hypothetical protein
VDHVLAHGDYELSDGASAFPLRVSCHRRHGQKPSISTSSEKLRAIRIMTMMPRTPTLSMRCARAQRPVCEHEKCTECAENHDPRPDRLNDLDDF